MMDWHWTWQDPVALGLVVLGLAFVFLLRARVGSKGSCARCPMRDQHAPKL